MDTAEFLLEARRAAAMELILSAAATAAPESQASDNFITPASLFGFEDSVHDLVTCQMALKNWEGASWDAIGGHLNCSRQAAHQRFGQDVNYLLQHRMLPRSIRLEYELDEMQESIEYWMASLLGDWTATRKEWAEKWRDRRRSLRA